MGHLDFRAMKPGLEMIQSCKGHWRLLTDQGGYTFDKATSQLCSGDGSQVGIFRCEPISKRLWHRCQLAGNRWLPCVTLSKESIMALIGNPGNDGAYFVLSSQFNGAVYPSHEHVQAQVESYRSHFGLLQNKAVAQLVTHPAVAQFLLDNAANDQRTLDINTVNGILHSLQRKGFKFEFRNGYLKIPECDHFNAAAQAFAMRLHMLRPLVMEKVPAS